jgi:hypothetical protein
LHKKYFLISDVWVEYYQPYELELFSKNGACEEWIYKTIFSYEEKMQGNATIFYAVVGNKFYFKRDFVNIKSVIIINKTKYFIGYQTIINKEPKLVNIFINGKQKMLFYLTDLWLKENTRTLNTISNQLGEKIESIRIITEEKYKTIIKPNIIFTLNGIKLCDDSSKDLF